MTDAMTEADYLEGKEIGPLLTAVWDQLSDRKLRLFAAACCREVWHLLGDPCFRLAVETAERYADGEATDQELAAAQAAAWNAIQVATPAATRAAAQDALADPVGHAVRAAAATAAGEAAVAAMSITARLAAADAAADARRAVAWAAAGTSVRDDAGDAAWDAELDAAEATQAALWRCVAGNPWRPLPWPAGEYHGVYLQPAVQALAQRIYDTRDWGTMPILADALEEAGCWTVTAATILTHLRGSGPHARGCWCVDLILGLV